MCDRDCFNCIYDDCIVDGISPDEISVSCSNELFAKRENASERMKRYYKSHEDSKRYGREYYYRNADKCKARNKEYYENHKDYFLERNREWKRNHKELLRERRKKYYENWKKKHANKEVI